MNCGKNYIRTHSAANRFTFQDYTGKCAAFLKCMLNIRLTHGKHENRVTHVKRTFINASFTNVRYRTQKGRFVKPMFTSTCFKRTFREKNYFNI